MRMMKSDSLHSLKKTTVENLCMIFISKASEVFHPPKWYHTFEIWLPWKQKPTVETEEILWNCDQMQNLCCFKSIPNRPRNSFHTKYQQFVKNIYQ